MKDKFYLGTIYGIALPLLTYILVDLFQEKASLHFSKNFFYILCIGVNVIIFQVAIKKKYDKLAKGILFVTFIYALIFAFNYLRK